MVEKLNPEELKLLQGALLSAFPSEGALEQVVFFELGENLKAIREGNNYSDVVRNLIIWAITNGRLEDLITGARRVNSGNAELRAFAEQHHARQQATANPPTAPVSPLTPQVRMALAQALLKVPPVLSFEGRSSLLVGLRWAQSLNRSPTNAGLDLNMTIDQLDSLGQLDSGAWPLLIMLDNAISFVAGTAAGRDLMKLREQLKQAYEGGGTGGNAR